MSPVAFDAIHSIVDAYIAIDDEWAFEAMRRLGRPEPPDTQVRAGASGAASLGGLLATFDRGSGADFRSALGMVDRATVLVVVTEGVTDPAAYSAVLSRP